MDKKPEQNKSEISRTKEIRMSSERKAKRKRIRKVVILVLILLTTLAALISMEYGKTVTDGKIPTSQSKSIKDFFYDSGSKADFAVYDEVIYFCTKDGFQCIDSSGNVLWSDTYNMTLPYMVQSKGIVGVSEQKGKILSVYNKEGKLYSIQTENPIASISVNELGYSSIILSENNEYELQVFNNSGNQIFGGVFQLLQGIPVSSSISSDGNILAINFVNIHEINISSTVSFYDISPNQTKTGETNDSVLTSFNEDNATCGIVKFLDTNNAVVVSDKTMTFVSVKPYDDNKLNENMKIDFQNKVTEMAFDNNQNVYVAYGEKIFNANDTAPETGTVICYDKSGNEKFRIHKDSKITGIYPGDSNFLIGMDKNYHNHNSSGAFIWQYHTNQDTKKILLIDDSDLILFVGSKQASILMLNEDALETEPPTSKDEPEEETEAPAQEKTTQAPQTQAQTETATVANSQKNTDDDSNTNTKTNNNSTNQDSSSSANTNSQKTSSQDSTNKKDVTVSEPTTAQLGAKKSETSENQQSSASSSTANQNSSNTANTASSSSSADSSSSSGDSSSLGSSSSSSTPSKEQQNQTPVQNEIQQNDIVAPEA